MSFFGFPSSSPAYYNSTPSYYSRNPYYDYDEQDAYRSAREHALLTRQQEDRRRRLAAARRQEELERQAQLQYLAELRAAEQEEEEERARVLEQQQQRYRQQYQPHHFFPFASRPRSAFARQTSPPRSQPHSEPEPASSSNPIEVEVEPTPAPTTPSNPSPSSSPSTEELDSAASTLQRHYRTHLFRRNALSRLSTLRTTFTSQKSSFVPPTTLIFQQSPQSSTDSGKLAFSSTNAPFLAYEDSLVKLLSQIDEVQSGGDRVVKKARRELVREIEKELEGLDERKAEEWEKLKVGPSSYLSGEEMNEDSDDVNPSKTTPTSPVVESTPLRTTNPSEEVADEEADDDDNESITSGSTLFEEIEEQLLKKADKLELSRVDDPVEVVVV